MEELVWKTFLNSLEFGVIEFDVVSVKGECIFCMFQNVETVAEPGRYDWGGK